MKFTALLLILAGCAAAQAADEPPAASSLQTGSVSLSTLDTKLDGIATKVDANTTAINNVNATLGNTNTGFEEVKGQIRLLQDGIDKVIDALSVKGAPESKPPQRVDAPPDETADQRKALNAIGGALDGIAAEIDAMKSDGSLVKITINATGESMSVREFIAKFYKGPRQFPGNVDDHLRMHGINPVPEGLSEETKQKWHAAMHDMHEAMQQAPKQLPTNKPVASTPPPQQQGWRIVCENGVCRRVPVLQQPAATSRREARMAAKGK